VVLSKGMCVIVVVGNRNGQYALPIFSKIHNAVINILYEMGIQGIQQQGISDITLNDRKILGSSLYLGSRPDFYYYQSCLMVSSELELINRFLKYPPREPDYRMKRAHSAFCTTLKNEGYAETAASIGKNLTAGLPCILK
jgi:lipoate---protein ligase